MSDLAVLNLIAYLDPGTGSLLVQFLLGAIVGSGVWFRKHVIATVASLFRIGKSSEETPSEAPQEAAPETPPEPADEASDAPQAAEVSGETEEAPEKVTEVTH